VASSRVAMGQACGEVWAKDEASGAAVSWPTAFANLDPRILGAGIGLPSVSPWPNDTAQAPRVSAGAIVCLMFAQLVASSIGGYLTRRLRPKWISLHTHKIYFRDTAHGLIVWSDALVIVREGAGRIFRELSQSAGREI
jgi:hypothetical protein